MFLSAMPVLLHSQDTGLRAKDYLQLLPTSADTRLHRRSFVFNDTGGE